MKTPKYYRAPLIKRSDIVAWLVDRATVSNARRGYGLFTFNVKCHNYDLSFGNLLAIETKAGDLPCDSIPYLLECRERLTHQESESLYQTAIENAGRSVMENDGYRMLWDDNGAIADWAFDGRSGGWLCLTSFDGVTLKPFDEDILTDPETAYVWLRSLYRFLVQCDHDFRREAVKSEIEWQAASTFFHNTCSDVQTAEMRAAKQAKQDEETIATAPCYI